MDTLHPAGPLIGPPLALAALLFSLRQRRRQRLLADLPTSKVQGVFIGLVELKGSAESESPLVSHLAGRRCVDYEWKVEEHWRRTVTTTTTDSKGRRRTTTRTTTGWDTVARGGDHQSFYLKDDTGAVLVHPRGARVDRASLFERIVSRADPLYHGKGPSTSVSGSTGKRRFRENGIPLHTPVYLVGSARERADVVAPEIAATDGSEFIVSTRDESSVSRGLATASWIAWIVGFLATPLALLIAAHNRAVPPSFLHGWIAFSILAYLGLWAAGWVWMAHNSIIGLRERVRQGWSLIDVQLKRRHDLLPSLAAAVAGFAAHERDVQTFVADLRTQGQATRPGAAGPDFDGLAPELRVIAEKYPGLKAHEGFAALQRELVTTEQRIALARAYYNDIATHYATRLEIIPDRWIASLRKLTPEPLLSATRFERASVEGELRRLVIASRLPELPPIRRRRYAGHLPKHHAEPLRIRKPAALRHRIHLQLRPRQQLLRAAHPHPRDLLQNRAPKRRAKPRL
jgi:hypothetical protein